MPPSNTTPGPAAFSQPNPFEYTPAPHRDREVNIWKLACRKRVEFLLRRYGIDNITALVASEAHARFPSPFTHPSNTRFRLYTPASCLEHASYTYESAEFEAIDFDMDDEEDEDEDLGACDLGAHYDVDYDDDEEDAEGEDSFSSSTSFYSRNPSHDIDAHTTASPQTTSSTSPQSPPQTHQLTLLRTPPLSSLHVTLLYEPPCAFMGRGTPPDRRRLSEWGRWGCVQVYGKGGERRRLSLGHGIHLHHGQCGERRHENPPPLHLTEPPHTPQQHEDSHPHPHPNPHEDPPHTHTHAVPGEWTSFLLA
ncbi:hypothetical protein EDD22DRAFT_954554 [Suillus occidentalis]|nr:hypothetical protein EDD22DRAFT_954554 [Suillus occidentalis]